MMPWKLCYIGCVENLWNRSLTLFIMIWLRRTMQSNNSQKLNLKRNRHSRMIMVIVMALWLIICYRFLIIYWNVFVAYLNGYGIDDLFLGLINILFTKKPMLKNSLRHEVLWPPAVFTELLVDIIISLTHVASLFNLARGLFQVELNSWCLKQSTWNNQHWWRKLQLW